MNIFKKLSVTIYLFLFVTLGVFASATVTFAQSTQLKMAIIDTDKVFQNSQAYKQVNQTVAGRRNQFQQEFKQKEQNLMAANQELVRQKSILAPEVLAQKKADINKQAAVIRSEAKQRNKSLNQLRNSGLSQIKKQLDVIIKQIVEAKNIDLILKKNSIVWTKPSLDITDEVIQKLNASLPALSIQ